jgi:hypothetical protein
MESALDTGNTAWVLTSAAMVLLMIPGLAFFYGGMVRSKSVLNMLMMVMSALFVVGILWVAFGYSIAFGTDIGDAGLLGSITENAWLTSLMADSLPLIRTFPSSFSKSKRAPVSDSSFFMIDPPLPMKMPFNKILGLGQAAMASAWWAVILRNDDSLHIPLARTLFTSKHPLTTFPQLWADFPDESIKFIRNKYSFLLLFNPNDLK